MTASYTLLVGILFVSRVLLSPYHTAETSSRLTLCAPVSIGEVLGVKPRHHLRLCTYYQINYLFSPLTNLSPLSLYERESSPKTGTVLVNSMRQWPMRLVRSGTVCLTCSTKIYSVLTECFWTMVNAVIVVPVLLKLTVCERGINEVNTQNENIIPSFSKCLKEKMGCYGRNKSPS